MAKGRRKNLHKALMKSLNQKVGFQANGKRTEAPRQDVMVLQRVLAAVQGDTASLKFVIKYMNEQEMAGIPEVMVSYKDTDGSCVTRYSDGRIKSVDAEGKITWSRRERPGQQR